MQCSHRSLAVQQDISNRQHRSLTVNTEDLAKVCALLPCLRASPCMLRIAATSSAAVNCAVILSSPGGSALALPHSDVHRRRLQYCEENDWLDFYQRTVTNVQRMTKLMAEAADDLMPEPAHTANLKKDVFDVMLHNVRPLCRTRLPIACSAACIRSPC